MRNLLGAVILAACTTYPGSRLDRPLCNLSSDPHGGAGDEHRLVTQIEELLQAGRALGRHDLLPSGKESNGLSKDICLPSSRIHVEAVGLELNHPGLELLPYRAINLAVVRHPPGPLGITMGLTFHLCA